MSAGQTAAESAPPPRPTRSEFRRALASAPFSAWFGMAMILLFVLMGIFAEAIAPYSETEVVGAAYLPADGNFLLGTDQVGRDIWSRIVFGARNTIGIAFVITALAFLIGCVAGMIAATLGGLVDQLLSRLVDVLMSIPQLIFALLLLTIAGTGLVQMILVIAILDSTRVYRLARAVTVNIVAMDYIEAAKLRGEGLFYLMRREILPNAMAPLVAEFGLRFCFIMLLIAALSFLGLGIQPPTADWASMVAENKTLLTFAQYDWLAGVTPLIPAAFIALLTVSVNLVVDWMLHRASGLKD